MKVRYDDQIGYRGTFEDRIDAGRRLAECLTRYAGKDLLVLGIPRGGVPVAAEVARRLNADLDVVVARKVGAPHSPELAIGAVTANGGRFVNQELVRDLRIPDTYLHAAMAKELAEAQRREERFRDARPAIPARGRVVILVDDGLATGATMLAAVRSVRSRQPERLIVAVPVGSPEACDALRGEVDEVVCLYHPESFVAVGIYYQDFQPVDDARVREILREGHARASEPPRRGTR